MSIKKALLLGSMALALVAFVVPASASALTLKDAGAEVNDKEAELTGEVGFTSLGGGIHCVVHLVVTINGQTVDVKSYTLTTTTCKGSGQIRDCTVTGDTVTGLPWNVDVDATKLTVTGVHIDIDLSPTVGKTCAPTHSTLNAAALTATPDSTTAIHSVAVFGEGDAFIEGVEVESEFTGSLSVVGANSGTYAIG